METVELLLSAHPFLRGIHEWYIEQLSRYAKQSEFKAGEYLLREGSDATSFFLILEGNVTVGTSPGGRFIPIQKFGPNDIVGWSWLMPPHKWHFHAIADTPTKVIVLDGVYLRAKCEEDPVLGYQILKRLTQHVIQRLNALRLKAAQDTSNVGC